MMTKNGELIQKHLEELAESLLEEPYAGILTKKSKK